MICPDCGSEYRPGITRCASCGVPLEERRAREGGGAHAHPRPSHRRPPEPLGDYCGFLGLDDARQARDALRREGIPSEIVIREPEDAAPEDPVREEYWLRVPVRRLDAVARIVGYDGAETHDHGETGEGDGEDSFACSVCGARVADSDAACPGCGATFED